MPDRSGGAQSRFDAATKLVTIISIGAAIAFGAVYGARGWSWFSVECLTAFALAVLAGRVLPALALPLTLAATYLVPAGISILHGEYYWNFNPIWYAWSFGFLVSAPKAGWSFPERWRLPLIFWALVIAVSWPIVVAREADFTIALLNSDLPPNSVAGGPPWFVNGWVTGTAAMSGLCLLWLDWFFEHFRDHADRFRRRVLAPLAVGAVCACAVAMYQGLLDITWLSGGQWPTIGRAPGTFMDADAFGAFAGWWSVVFPAFVLAAAATPTTRLFGVIGYLIAWGGLWASGSRMALLGGVISVVLVATEAIRLVPRGRSSRFLATASVAVFALVVVLGVAASRAHWSTASPVDRAISSFRSVPTTSVAQFARDTLWNRGAPYGTVSVQMVEQSPVSGIGIGAFHTMFPDYAFALMQRATPDNAQSWYRHQLAELGIVGSLGWMVWLSFFVILLFRGRARAGNEAEARVARVALVTIGIVSAVSMPTQHFANAFTVIALAAWYSTLVQSPAVGPIPPARLTWARRGIVVLVVVYAASTAYMGWVHFRPAYRAMMGDWGYAYGVYDAEMIDGQEAHWTAGHAVNVIAARKRWLKLTVWVNFDDVETKPTDVRVWDDGNLIVRSRLRTTTPIVSYARVPDGDHRVMLESKTSRVVRPRDFGANDDRELGMAMRWEFIDRPPADAESR